MNCLCVELLLFAIFVVLYVVKTSTELGMKNIFRKKSPKWIFKEFIYVSPTLFSNDFCKSC